MNKRDRRDVWTKPLAATSAAPLLGVWLLAGMLPFAGANDNARGML